MRRNVALMVAGVLLFAGCTACSGDDDDRAEGPPSTESTSTTSTTQPPGTDPEAVKPFIEDLISQLDDVTDQIVRDPNVVLDPNSELVAQFKDLYAPDAEGLAGSLGAFERSASEGVRLEPVNSETTGRTEITGDVVPVDENTVTVPICSISTYRTLMQDGTQLEYFGGLAQPGEAHLVRVNGQWRVERVDVFENTICTEVGPA